MIEPRKVLIYIPAGWHYRWVQFKSLFISRKKKREINELRDSIINHLNLKTGTNRNGSS